MTAELLGIDPIRPGGANTVLELQSWASEPGFVSDMEARVYAVMRGDEYLAGIQNPRSVAEQVQEKILAGEVKTYDLKGELLYVVTARRSSGVYSWTNVYWPDNGIPGVNNDAWYVSVKAEIHGEEVILDWGIIAPCGNDAPIQIREIAEVTPPQELDQRGSVVILIRYYRQQYEVDYSVDFDIDS